jgi:periplasmic copper chaperone A
VTAPTPGATVSRRPLVVPLLPLLATVALVAGCASGTPAIEVGHAQAAVPSGGSSQIVIDVTNDGDGDDRLTGAVTPAALAVELHRTTIADGRATMEQLDGIDLPAGSTLRFRPGDLHLMLVVPDGTVVEGGTFELTLEFERSDDVTVPVSVVDLLDLAESTFEEPEP